MNTNPSSFIASGGVAARLLAGLPQAAMIALADRRWVYGNPVADVLLQKGQVVVAAQHLMRIGQWPALSLDNCFGLVVRDSKAIELPLWFAPDLATGVLHIAPLSAELVLAAALPYGSLLLLVQQDRHALRQQAKLDALCAHCTLSAAERQVLVLLAQGLTVTAAAQRLGLRVCTVRCHVRHLLKKTGSPSLAQMLCWIGSARELPG